MKVDLEEWRHWLEGAEQPYMVWTDHKNLEYLKDTKRLYSTQARWTLFFPRFNFNLCYQTGSKNTKPDTLSRVHSPETDPEPQVPILPVNCFVGSITWEAEEKVNKAIQGAETPPGTLPNRLSVPTVLRGMVIHCAHTVLISCHHGLPRIVSRLQKNVSGGWTC